MQQLNKFSNLGSIYDLNTVINHTEIFLTDETD